MGTKERWYRFINAYVAQVDRARTAHARAARRFDRLHWGIGIPATVLAALPGALALSGVSAFAPFVTPPGIGLISALATVLIALQTFGGFERRAHDHTAAVLRYDRFLAELAFRRNLPPRDQEEAEAIFAGLYRDYADLPPIAVVKASWIRVDRGVEFGVEGRPLPEPSLGEGPITVLEFGRRLWSLDEGDAEHYARQVARYPIY